MTTLTAPSLTGTIKKLVPDRGFGFIRSSSGQDLFFHTSSCTTPFDTLEEGDHVTFILGDDKKGKGPRAERVQVS